MTLDISLRPEAERDLAEAALWYETNRSGLGREFLNEVEAAPGLIGENPAAYPVVHRGIRRALIRRFPFGIFYQLTDSNIVVVLAVLHGSRRPRSWQDRA